ncbi:hypothetical protein SLEP1_g26110 [Rubroshorea leprosula]|uniref:Uncharacterized protein n=1 Tax=Rubroshorea leprosula TaxID=152421 RepID=A0AAV5JS47_9ROSI|nr:hypothetical protein SLEP1_g26110 [Rubroshorea leprosula]
MSKTLLLSTAQPSSEELDLLDRNVKRIKEDVSLNSQSKDPLLMETMDLQQVQDQSNPQGALMDEDLPTLNFPQLSGATTRTFHRDKLLVVEDPSVISFSTIPNNMEEDSHVDDDRMMMLQLFCFLK